MNPTLITRPTNQAPARLWAITDPTAAQPGLYRGKKLIATVEQVKAAGYSLERFSLKTPAEVEKILKAVEVVQ